MMERRQAERVEPVGDVRVKVKTTIPADVVDISTRGVQLETAQPLAIRALCQIKLVVDGTDCILNATVRRCRVWRRGKTATKGSTLLYRTGLEFERPSKKIAGLLGISSSASSKAKALSDTVKKGTLTLVDENPEASHPPKGE